MITPQHPVVEMAFWNTSAAETQAMVAIYDELAGTDPELRKKLLALMDWAGHQRSCEEAYNNTDFSGA